MKIAIISDINIESHDGLNSPDLFKIVREKLKKELKADISINIKSNLAGIIFGLENGYDLNIRISNLIDRNTEIMLPHDFNSGNILKINTFWQFLGGKGMMPIFSDPYNYSNFQKVINDDIFDNVIGGDLIKVLNISKTKTSRSNTINKKWLIIVDYVTF